MAVPVRVSSKFEHLLPVATVTQPMQEERQVDCCSICLESFSVGQKVTLLPCTHLFHRRCVHTAFKHDHRCPVCRREFPLSERHQYGLLGRPHHHHHQRRRLLSDFFDLGIPPLGMYVTYMPPFF